jgi:hypothetical protein
LWSPCFLGSSWEPLLELLVELVGWLGPS